MYKAWANGVFSMNQERNHLPLPPGEGWGEGKKPLPPSLLAFARTLREELTDAERLMWTLLCDRRFLGHKFRRQHPIPPYVLDFYCHETRLAIELDGGQHDEEGGRERDARRAAFLAEKGIRALRFWNNDVFANTEGVMETIFESLSQEDEA